MCSGKYELIISEYYSYCASSVSISPLSTRAHVGADIQEPTTVFYSSYVVNRDPSEVVIVRFIKSNYVVAREIRPVDSGLLAHVQPANIK